jgi:oligoribonuclease NrnB/cAMP/cGMP phosphodiesterase (DHH superfamily)
MILSHADHDGVSSSVLFNSFMQIKHGNFANTLFPKAKLNILSIFAKIEEVKPRLLVIMDFPLNKFTRNLEKILNHTTILNFDHHDVIKIRRENYIDLNPHKWNIEFLNSSGLVWKALHRLEPRYFAQRAWVGGVGAAQDYCLEGNREMFEFIREANLLDDFTLTSLLNSRIMILAKVVRASIRKLGVQFVYDHFLKACIDNDFYSLLNHPKMRSAYDEYRKQFLSVYKTVASKSSTFVRCGVTLKFYVLDRENINMISDICELEKERAVYIAYGKGKVSFRSLFTDYDVRQLAKCFGGGGANPRAAGARTKLNYTEFIQRVLSIFEQQNLGLYM